jgi:predicted RND superfamily exporter protein
MGQQAFLRNSRLTLLVMLLCLPWIVWATQFGLRSTRNAPAQWVSKQFQQRRDFDQFARDFQTHNSLVISWPGCTVDDPRLAALETRLTRSLPSGEPSRASTDGDGEGDQSGQRIADVATGYTALRTLMSEPLSLSRSAALRRLDRTLVGPDGKSSCAVIGLTPLGDAQRRVSVREIQTAAAQVTGLPDDQLRMAGDVLDGLAIDTESNRASMLAIPSAVLSLLLCWLCLRSWRLTAAILVVAAFGEGLVLALVPAFGLTMNAVFSVMAPLAFVLTVSGGVHLTNYYYEQLSKDAPSGGAATSAATRALRAGWAPCALAALTTAIGLGSLLVSDILPIRQFGAMAACGILVTTGLLFLVVPGAMVAHEKRLSATPRTQAPSRGGGFWHRLTQCVAAAPTWIAVGGLLTVLITGYGLRWIRTSVSVRELLSSNSRTMQDYRWLEQRIGPLVPAEILVHFDPQCPLDVLQRVELLRKIEQVLRDDPLDASGGITSAATMVPEIPEPGGLRKMARRTVLRNRLQDQLPEFQTNHWLHNNGQVQSWRINVRVAALGDVDYGVFLDELRQQVDPLLQRQGITGVSATYTGLMPLVYRAQRALLRDLGISFLTALGLVTLVMILVQRSVVAGLMAMVPNIFPSAVLFGGMGWLNLTVDIGTVMTASVALGIAVDGTLHYLAWYRRERHEGRTPAEAVERTYRHCGVAMAQTTVICGLGLLVFVVSGFVPTRKFALMLAALLSAALVGDLLLLPALLLTPLGKLRSLSR